jgi:hypothetical protein
MPRIKKIRKSQCNAKTRNATTSLKQNKIAMQMLMPRNQKMQVSPFQLLMCRIESALAVLALVGIANSETRHTIAVYHRVVGIQESERSISALLSVHANNAKANALVKVVVESDTHGKVRAGVECARTLIIVDGSAGESVLEYPVCT